MPVRWSAFVVLGFAGACVPEGDAPPDANEKVCSAYLTVGGQFEASRPPPADEEIGGCWPVGTWRFGATLEESECDVPPVLEPEYAFTVERDEEFVETYTYLNEPERERVLIKVTSGGGGFCEGTLELYSDDGTKVLTLKPAIQENGVLNGFGEYDVFKGDRW